MMLLKLNWAIIGSVKHSVKGHSVKFDWEYTA